MIRALVLSCVMVVLAWGAVHAQDAATEAADAAAVDMANMVKGIVKEIAEDGSFIVVNETKITTTKEFLEDSYLEIGDNVEITTEKTATGLKAVAYNYIFEDEAGDSEFIDEPMDESASEPAANPME